MLKIPLKYHHIVNSFVALLVSILLVATPMVSAQKRPTVALVLGGGSARGLSHIGLLKALEEGGIPIDYIIGTSMGSVIAGLYAAGFSADNLDYMISNVSIPEMFVPTIPPKGGFLSTQRFKTFLDVLTDNAQMESLPISFHTVVINLLTGEEETLSSGPLSTGILASMSIPAMFPPVRIGDDYYVDGGMKSLVPVDVAKELGADLIIAVDVRKKLENINHDTVLSNIQLTLLFLLATDTPRQLELADIVMKPPVAYDSYMDYDRGDYFIDVGYDGAKEYIPAIRAALLELDPDFPFLDGSPMYGYPDDVFTKRFWAAVDASEQVSLGPSVSPRMALRFDGELGSQFGVVVPFAEITEGVPLFASYASQTENERSTQTISVGVGSCGRFCVSALGRRGTNDTEWALGAGVEGSVRRYLRYAGEWEATGNAAGAWHVSLVAPDRVEVTEPQGELQLQLFRDLRGLYGLASPDMQAEVRYRYYVPWNRTDFWEAVSTSTNWFIGAGARAGFSGSDVQLQPVGEVGLAFEARLFGLYPLRSRVLVEYGVGEMPWAIRWTLGNW